MSNLKSITDLSAIDFRFNDRGLIPAILQDYHTREILMMAWMNAESLALTLETGNATFFSRSRGTLWTKGETSGHFQKVVAIDYDCDADTLLLQVNPIGPACHTGHRSCFYRRLADDDALDRGNSDILTVLAAQIEDRKSTPSKAPTPTIYSTKASIKSAKRSAKKPPRPSSPRRTAIRTSSSARPPICSIT